MCGTDSRTVPRFFIVTYPGQVFDKVSSGYGFILRHIRCKRFQRRPLPLAPRRTCLRRPPRSSNAGNGMQLTHWGVHRICVVRNRPRASARKDRSSPALVCLAHNIRQGEKGIRLFRGTRRQGFPAHRQEGTEDRRQDNDGGSFAHTQHLLRLRNGRRDEIFRLRQRKPALSPLLLPPHTCRQQDCQDSAHCARQQIDSLRIICNAGEDNVIVATGDIGKFKEGQTVRITEGKFAGVTGKVARYHGQQRVAVVIDSVLTVCTAYIPSAFLRRI